MKFTKRELEVIGKLSAAYLRSPDKTIKIETIAPLIPMLRPGAKRTPEAVRGSAAHFMRFLCLKLAVAGVDLKRVTLVGRSNNAEYAFKGIAEAKRAARIVEAGAKVAKPKASKPAKTVARGSVIKRPRKKKEAPPEENIEQLPLNFTS
jgi:hypothetical protein